MKLPRRALILALWVGVSTQLCATKSPGQQHLDSGSTEIEIHDSGYSHIDLRARNLISELGSSLFEHTTTPCDPEKVPEQLRT